MRVLAIAFLVILAAVSSGLADTIHAVSASRQHVGDAVTAASNGDTVRLPAGESATWTSQLRYTKGITLDLNGCTITRNFRGSTQLIWATAVDGFASRITGGTFSGGASATGFSARYIRFDSTATGSFRVDNCTFNDSGGGIMVETYHQAGQALIDHCAFNVSGVHEQIHNNGYGAGNTTGWDYTVNQGSADALYVENCTFNWIAGSKASGANSAMQNYYGSRTVFRYNTIRGAQFDVHGATVRNPPSAAGRWYECYENDHYISNDTSKLFQLRGGSGVVFNNRLHNLPGAAGSRVIQLWSESPGAYPVPYLLGRGKTTTPGKPSTQTSAPLYIWNNTVINEGGGTLGMQIGTRYDPDATPDTIQLNRDYFTTAKSGYTPYTYPHPLQGVAPTPTPTATPSSLSWESTRGVIQAPFVNKGNSISQTSATFDPRQGGEALYDFNVTAAGDYTVSVVVNAPHHAANSLLVNIDSQPSSPAMIWDIPPSSGFIERVVSWRGNGTDTNNEFTPKKFSLSAGSHQLIIRAREANVQIGRITVGPAAPSAPSNLAVEP